MKKLRIPFLVFMTISFVLPPTAGSAEPPQAPKALILPLTGVGTDSVTVNGTVARELNMAGASRKGTFALQPEGEMDFANLFVRESK